MNRPILRLLFAILAALLAGHGGLHAQAPEPTIVVVGTTIQSPVDNHHWGYLSWLASKPELLRDRPYAVYLKQAGPDDPAPFVHVGTVRPQTDPAVINTLFDRARHLGQDMDKLNEAIASYFTQLHPDGGVPVADMFGALTAQSLQDDGIFQMLVFMGRSYPGAALSLGTGFAARIGLGENTFELREKPPGSEEFSAVVGRVTVTGGQPFVFSAPGAPVLVPSADRNGNALPAGDITNDMNAKLRWASPELLRRQSLLLRGFHVYRVSRDYAQAQGWDACPVPADLATLDWKAEVESSFPHVAKVNRLPILPRKFYSEAEGADFSTDVDFYTQDDNRHNGLTLDDDGNAFDAHQTFVPGAEFYYFVVCEDLLGRPGATSCGTLLKICDRDPPVAPKSVKVTNDFVFNEGAGTSDQRHRVSWPQLPDAEGAVAYFVYRWRSLPELKEAELLEPLALGPANLVAGPVPHIVGGQTLSVVDNLDAVNSPKIGSDPQFGAAGDDAGQTIWYTVVAVDDSACGGNFSPHSAPADGVLRDRVGPTGGGGVLTIRCCTPELTPAGQTTITAPGTLDPVRLHFALAVARGGDQPGEIRSAEFWLEDSANKLVYPLATGDFSEDPSLPLVFFVSIDRPAVANGVYHLRGKVIQSDGRESPVANHNFHGLPQQFYHQGIFNAGRDCRPKILRTHEEPCRTHTPLPGDDGELTPIDIKLEFPPGVREWRLFRTVDGGPMNLVRQGVFKTPTNPGQFLSLQDIIYSPVGCEVCFFVQYFDEHANAGPMNDLGCIKSTGKPPAAPVLARIQSFNAGDTPKARVRFFSPTVGIERFDVIITRSPGTVPAGISTALSYGGQGTLPVEDQEGQVKNKLGRRFETGVVGHTLQHSGPEFIIILDQIELNKTYHVGVRAVGIDGQSSLLSNVAEFVWKTPEENLLPGVDWPYRTLPGSTPTHEWDSRIEAKYLGQIQPGLQRVGVRIGRHFGARACSVGSGEFDPANPLYALPGNMDPMVHLFPWSKWKVDAGEPAAPPLLPGMLYRYQVDNDLFDGSSNDLVQVTPLMESIAHKYETPVGGALPSCNGVRIYDPHIAVTSSSGNGATGSDFAFDLWLLDSMPVTAGARYAYLLVVFDQFGEIRTVVPAGEVDVPLIP